MCPCVGPVGSEHGTSGPGLDPRPCRSHRATTAHLRASRGAVGDGRRGGPRDREAGPPDRRGRDGGRQELRLPGPGDPGDRRPQDEGRRLDAYHRAAGAVAQQGYPVPPLGDAAGILGGAGQGPVELHQPPPPAGGDPAPGFALPAARRDRPARHDPDVVEANAGRQPRRPRLPSASLGLGGHPE